MSDDPWLTIIGVGEDGCDGLSSATRQALQGADVVIGPDRHLQLIGEVGAECQTWPVPFADGIETLRGMRGRKVVMLASGNPFWFGAGSTIAEQFEPHEWRALPAPSVFSLVAARLGWSLQSTVCVGLHAAPFARLRAAIAPDVRAIVLVRDGEAIGNLAQYLIGEGFGATSVHVMEALGGPRERVRKTTADAFDLADVTHPVAVALEFAGGGAAIPNVSGRSDALFEHDGQITKRPVRALTLSALAPVAGEMLWDIGAGSGSISIEWLLSHPSCEAVAVEADPVRAGRVRSNADRLGADRLWIVEGRAPEALAGLELPDAVFIGGGLSDVLLDALWAKLAPGCRIVANAVTLESESTVVAWQARVGGALMRIQLAEATALGSRRGWQSSYPIVQWSVTR